MTGKLLAKDKDAGPVTVTVTPEPMDEFTADISEHPGGWHLVTHGSWQVSVGPDSLIMLPRHLIDGEAADFCRAVMVAAEVAAHKRAENEELGKGDDRSLPPKIQIKQGGVPAGAIRMPFTARATPAPSGAAPARRHSGPQPAGTQGAPPPRVPIPRAPRRRGQ